MQVIVVSCSCWSRYWKTAWFRDGDKYQKAYIDAWTQVADAWTQTADDMVHPMYDVQAPYLQNRDLSDQENLRSVLLKGTIHEMALRVPLLHTPLPRKRGQQVAHAKGCSPSTAGLALYTAIIMADVHRAGYAARPVGISSSCAWAT